ncbi:hypothetical protein [Sulfurihydrogenibium sp.]|uniref:hypothetical protein n=1 Tax=Sulfurihydrogenibium sp. TaxID=2053621 RepID=UPI00260922A9|nr:hypothetical protein [Sulfurihydrogenibium sp.]
MENLDLIKLLVVLILAFFVMKLVGFAVRLIVKVLIFIAVVYFIFHYFVAK